MNKFQLFSVGLIAGALTFASCDDVVDCGCDCDAVRVTGFELLDQSESMTQGQIDSAKVFSGTRVIIYGENLTDVTAIKFGNKSAELYPAYMNDNQIVFKVPDGVSETVQAVICTKSCSSGFAINNLNVELAPPCAAMCDNEFAVKSMTIKGSSFVDGMQVFFARVSTSEQSGIKYDKEGKVTIIDFNTIKVDIPEGFKEGERLLLKNKAGESFSEFVFHDNTNLLITGDDEAYLNKFNSNKPDADETYNKEADKAQYFTSPNNNGEFFIFHDMDFKDLTYNPWSEQSNPNFEVTPKYATVFGMYGEQILQGKTKATDYVLKFEVCTPEGKNTAATLNVGFFDAGVWGDVTANNIRGYCASWCPAELAVSRPADAAWKVTGVANEWGTGGEWVTVAIPMSEFKLNLKAGAYVSSWGAEGIRYIKGGDLPWGFMGDMENGVSYAEKFPLKKTTELSADGKTYDRDAVVSLCEDEKYALPDEDFSCDEKTIPTVKKELIRMHQEGHGCPWTGLNFDINTYDQASSDVTSCMFAIDNVRIVPADNNGMMWEYDKFGVPTRDFFNKPVTTCK